MSANIYESELSLLQWSIAWLQERLPDDWRVELSNARGPGEIEYSDANIALEAAGGYRVSIAVEARSSLTPREAENLLPRLARVLHSMAGNVPVLIVAPWLSRRTQELLAEGQINYIDQTGNARIRLRNPALYIGSTGAARNPRPQARGKAQLRGAKAGRLIRTLIDVGPPYTVKDLSVATGLAPGYVSRLIDALDEEALIERVPRGPVEAVDIAAIVRRWATSYDVFKVNRLDPYIAPAGSEGLLARLADDPGLSGRVAITGSFAARRLAPVASPALLLLYAPEPDRLAGELDLLPTDEGANVGLLSPFDPVVWAGMHYEGGLRFVAPSQAAVDCLTGNGRMPAEGEALLQWMLANADIWRGSVLQSFEAWER